MSKKQFAIVDEDGSFVAESIPPTQGYKGRFAYPRLTLNDQKYGDVK